MNVPVPQSEPHSKKQSMYAVLSSLLRKLRQLSQQLPTKFSPFSVTSKRRNYKSGRSANFKKPKKKLSKNR